MIRKIYTVNSAMTFAKNSLSSWVPLILMGIRMRAHSASLCLSPCLSASPPGDRGQPEQHAVPGRVRPFLWAMVPSLGDGPPDPADPHPREGPHAPLAPHWLRVQIPAGHTPTAQQES